MDLAYPRDQKALLKVSWEREADGSVALFIM